MAIGWVLVGVLACNSNRETAATSATSAPAVSPTPDATAPRKQVRLRVTSSDDDSQPPEITVDNRPPRRGALPEQEDTTVYKVVINHEEQYSIWPADRENPLGWKDAGTSGSKSECLDFIKEVWTDMRPLSLRKKLEQAAPESEP